MCSFDAGSGCSSSSIRPARACEPSLVGGASIPAHGATGPGHVAFAIPDADIPAWRARLENAGVVIESEVM